MATEKIKTSAAEQALKESEKKYKYLFESAIDMIHFVDDEYNIVDVNETELGKLGYSREELIGQPLNKILHPDFRPKTEGLIPTVKSGETIKSYETALLTKDGKKIHAKGFETMIWEKVAGEWRIIHSHSSTRKVK